MARTAIVIGAGLGGLSAALALQRVGFEVEVYEKSQELKEVGAGIVLYPNAINVLRKLDVYDAVASAGSFGRHGKYMTPNGKVLVEMDLKDVGLEKEAIAIHRADLQHALVNKLGADKIHLGMPLTSFDDNGKVTARFPGGSFASGDLLVGADGLHSAVRKQYLKDGDPQFANCFAWRGVVTGEFEGLPSDSGLLILGSGLQFGAMRIGQGRVYWFGAVADKKGAGARTSKKDVLELFGNWTDPIPQLINATAQEALLTHDLYDRKPTFNWGKDGITLLGDAAHPMVPFMGQGGCQALEDSIALGASLKEASSIPIGLRKYENLRKARTANFVTQSRKAMKASMTSNPLIAAARDLVFSKMPPQVLMKNFHTLNSYDMPDLD
ncbi:MAG: FAD-dependent monooxygenase [Candidatus Obscuribacterales bacterium]|nr:FAD-dependent monooxygenase [Candidatus Obscuribacterales bacterium]